MQSARRKQGVEWWAPGPGRWEAREAVFNHAPSRQVSPGGLMPGMATRGDDTLLETSKLLTD